MDSSAPIRADYRYLISAAELGSLTLAARALGVSQPAVSRAIQRVEGELGEALLIRTREGVTLTRTGEVLVRRLRKWVSDWIEIRNETLFAKEELAGRFRLGCHSSIGIDFAPAFLSALARSHPGIQVELVHQSSRETTDDVNRLRLDFGIVVDPLAHPNLTVRKLAEEVVGLWGRAGSRDSIVYYNPEMQGIERVLRPLQRRHPAISVISVNDYEVIASLVREGATIGILPGLIARRHGLRSVGELSGGLPSLRFPICLIYRKDAQRSAASRAVIDAVVRADRGAPGRSREKRGLHSEGTPGA